MEYLCTGNDYRSPPRKVSWIARACPTAVFYPRFLYLVARASWQARRGRLTVEARVNGSCDLVRTLESVGVRFEIENTSAFRTLAGPCVFVSNHMSTLETLVFTAIIEPYREITFVVKESLVRYPVFKHIMISRNPIVVGRKNPREDFETVLKGGLERLGRGISVVIFPQTTRTTDFNPAQFNSIGVKLARRAGVPIVPVALRTDAWGNNKRGIKDFGPIDPSRPARIHFGEPLTVAGNGKEEHERIVTFIGGKMQDWFPPDKQ